MQKFKILLLKFISLNQYLFFVGWRRRDIGERYAQVNKDFIFRLISKKKPPVFFIQIGANDGVKNDPINYFVKKYKWSGILVEPLPEYFRRLKENYKSEPQLIFENVGVGDQEGELSFYFMPSQYNEPDWLQQIGSFDRNAIEFNLAGYPDLVEKIAVETKPLITLRNLIEKHKVLNIDLLIIDAEGFEFAILKQLDDCPVKPEHIFFEWGCLTSETLNKLLDYLGKIGYQFYSCGSDILAKLEK
jgi:FkbM family methyltransferase